MTLKKFNSYIFNKLRIRITLFEYKLASYVLNLISDEKRVKNKRRISATIFKIVSNVLLILNFKAKSNKIQQFSIYLIL